MASSWSAKDLCGKFIQAFRERMQLRWILPLRHFSEFHPDDVVNGKIGDGIHETMEEFTKELTRLRTDAEKIPVLCQELLSELQKVVTELVAKNRDHRKKSECIANSLIEHICKLYEMCLEAKSHTENPDGRSRDLDSLEEEKSDAMKILQWGWLGTFTFKDTLEKNLEGKLEQIRIRFEGMQNASANAPKTTFTSTLPDFEIGESTPSWVKDEMLSKFRQFRNFLESKLPMRHFTQFYLDTEVSEVTGRGKSQILDEFTSKLLGHGLEAKVSSLFDQLLTEIERLVNELVSRNRDHLEKSEALMNPLMEMVCELYVHSVEAELSVRKRDSETFLKILESGKADALVRVKYCWKPGSSRYRKEQTAMLNDKLEGIKDRLLRRHYEGGDMALTIKEETISSHPTSTMTVTAHSTSASAVPDDITTTDADLNSRENEQRESEVSSTSSHAARYVSAASGSDKEDVEISDSFISSPPPSSIWSDFNDDDDDDELPVSPNPTNPDHSQGTESANDLKSQEGLQDDPTNQREPLGGSSTRDPPDYLFIDGSQLEALDNLPESTDDPDPIPTMSSDIHSIISSSTNTKTQYLHYPLDMQDDPLDLSLLSPPQFDCHPQNLGESGRNANDPIQMKEEEMEIIPLNFVHVQMSEEGDNGNNGHHNMSMSHEHQPIPKKIKLENMPLPSHIIRDQEDPRYYQCNVCTFEKDKPSTFKHSSVPNHWYCNTEEKDWPFVCNQCGKTFRNKPHLKKHETQTQHF